MKRIICLVIAVLMIFFAVSCNKEQQGNNNVISESKKNATYNDIVSALKSAGYGSEDEYGYSESILTEMKSEFNNVKSVKGTQLLREKHLSQYDTDIYDLCGLIYFEFSDEQSAIAGYDKLFIDSFESRPIEKSGDGYSKAILQESDYGQTYILSRVGNVVVLMGNDYDDYWDAELQYDNKPELILAELGY